MGLGQALLVKNSISNTHRRKFMLSEASHWYFLCLLEGYWVKIRLFTNYPSLACMPMYVHRHSLENPSPCQQRSEEQDRLVCVPKIHHGQLWERLCLEYE